jgi:hypothetical protein
MVNKYCGRSSVFRKSRVPYSLRYARWYKVIFSDGHTSREVFAVFWIEEEKYDQDLSSEQARNLVQFYAYTVESLVRGVSVYGVAVFVLLCVGTLLCMARRFVRV